MSDDKKNQALQGDKKLSPSVGNDQLGENNGESNCGCGGAKSGSGDNRKNCK